MRIGWLLLLAACTPTKVPGGDTSTLEPSDVVLLVDRTAPLGPVQPLTGVNKSPLLHSKTSEDTYDFGALYAAFGVTAVRAHDGAGDLCPIYQDDQLVDASDGTHLDADACHRAEGGPEHAAVWSVNDPQTVDRPSNYDFTEADAQIDAILAPGFELLLRLGESFNGPNDTSDPHVWARVAARIYDHYAVGWPSAMPDISRAPAWVEIHNEPDGLFWVGSDADFLALYAQTWDRVDGTTAPGLDRPRIGGSGFTDGGVSGWMEGHPGLIASFIGAEVGGDLDFLSVHHYGTCNDSRPADLGTYLHDVRAALDDAGGAGIPLLLTEWNIGFGNACTGALYVSAQEAAYVGAALALQQDPSLGLERSYFYSGVPPMSLFTMDETTHGLQVNPSAYAMLAHSTLAGTLDGLQVCEGSGTTCQAPLDASEADEPIHAVAATGPDGVLRLVVTNYSADPRSVEIRLDDTDPVPTSWEVTRAENGGAPVLLDSEIDPDGHYVPTTAGLQGALDLLQSDTPTSMDRAARVELDPWEVVQIEAHVTP